MLNDKILFATLFIYLFFNLKNRNNLFRISYFFVMRNIVNITKISGISPEISESNILILQNTMFINHDF